MTCHYTQIAHLLCEHTILQGRVALRLKVLHADAGIRQGEERLPPLVDSPSREEPRNVPALKAVEVVVCQDLQCNVQDPVAASSDDQDTHNVRNINVREWQLMCMSSPPARLYLMSVCQ